MAVAVCWTANEISRETNWGSRISSPSAAGHDTRFGAGRPRGQPTLPGGFGQPRSLAAAGGRQRGMAMRVGPAGRGILQNSVDRPQVRGSARPGPLDRCRWLVPAQVWMDHVPYGWGWPRRWVG